MLAKLLKRKTTEAPAEAEGDNSLTDAPPVLELVPEAALPAAPDPVRPAAGRGDRWDWVIATVCISAGVVGLRTVNDPVLWSELARGTSGSHRIGQLLKKSGGVRFRSAESPLWHDVYSGSEDVAAGDTVFTGEDGQAELRLDDGTVAEVEPNSLIVVQVGSDVIPDPKGWIGNAVGSFFATAKPESLLRIEQGTAKVNLRKDAGSLRLQIKGKTFSLSSKSSGGSAEVSVDAKNGKGGGAKFSSLSSGAVELSEDTENGEGSKVEFGQGQQAVLPGERGAKLAVQTVVMTPLLPAPGEQMMLPPDTPVVFTWKWESDAKTEGAKDSKAVLELDGAEKKTVSVTSQAEIAKVALAEGSYRWKLSTQTQASSRIETPWRSFSLLSLAPPQPVGPLGGAWISVPKGEGAAKVVFSWQRLPAGLQAELEWGFKPAEAGADATSPHLVTAEAAGRQENLEPGVYQWRVRARTADRGQLSSWSKPLNFTVRSEKEILAATPADTSSVLLAAPGPSVPAVTPAVPTPAAPVVAAAKKAVPEAPKPKHKPVRILAVGHASGSTRLGSSEKLDQVLVPLHWQALDDAKHYEVVVKDDSTGKTILSKNTKPAQLNLALHSLASIQFSYQVTAVTESGEKIASAPVHIEIQLSAPVLKTPSDGTSVAPNKQGTILVTWERTVLTDSYVIQISQDPAFRKKVREESATRNLLSLRGLSPGVSYYWRVQSLSHGHKSEWSQSSMFVID